MKLWPFNQHNWHEPCSYLAASLAVGLGIHLAARTGDLDWNARAGSVVICIGVLLAASRKVDRLEVATSKHQDEFKSAMRPHVKSVLQDKLKREPTFAEIYLAEAEIASGTRDGLPALFKAKRRALRLHEVALVLTGTLLNGFGPWLYRISAA